MGRVDCPLADVIVLLDVIETHRLAYTGHLIEFAHIFRQVRIIPDPLQIDLEVTVIHRVKPDQGVEQPPSTDETIRFLSWLLLITIGFLIRVVFLQLYMVKLVDPGRDDASKLVARVIDIRRCDTCGRAR